MLRSEFDTAIGAIWRHIGGNFRLPHTSTLDSWFVDVQNIPSAAVGWIVQRIKRECDSMPRNLAKKIREMWSVWQRERAGQDGAGGYSGTDCDECRGTGVLFFESQGNGCVCGCAKCDNWRKTFGEKPVCFTIEGLEAAGYRLRYKPQKRSWETKSISDVASYAVPGERTQR